MPLKILLADDSMTAQNMGKKILTEAGYDIVAVSNGAAALKKIAEIKPDIAILDVFMPGYTGPEVCERIKNVHETSKIPVLLTVGKMEMTAFKPEETNRVKADGLIIKPFEATDLLAVIQKMEKKLAPAKPLPTAFEGEDDTPIYEKTVKLDVREFRDASYDEWKTNAEEHTDEEPAKKPVASVPSEMAGAPAFMMEEPAATPPAPEARTTQVLEKGGTAVMPTPADLGYSPTIHLPPPATAGTVPDWAVAAPESAGIAPAVEPEAPAAEISDAKRETGVGMLLSKAKTWFGGAAINEAEAAPAEVPVPSASMEDAQLAPPAVVPAPAEFAPAPDLSVPVGMGSEELAPPGDLGVPVTMMSQELPPPSLEIPAEVPMEVPLEPVGLEPGHEVEAVTPHPIELGHAAHRDTVQMTHATDPALDTSMHRETHADVPVEMNPDLDTSMHRDASDFASHAIDPALVTDPSEMATAFPTNFGVANATVDPVGVAADVPGLYEDNAEAVVAAEAQADAAPIEASPVQATSAEEPQTGWRAEEHHLEDHEHGVRLEHEMAKHYAAQAAVAEPEPAPVVEAAAPAAAAAPTNAPDMQFAAAMAAAVGAQAPAANSIDATAAMDPEMIARVVQRVTERMRPDLIAEITKELMMEKQKEKK